MAKKSLSEKIGRRLKFKSGNSKPVLTDVKIKRTELDDFVISSEFVDELFANINSNKVKVVSPNGKSLLVTCINKDEFADYLNVGSGNDTYLIRKTKKLFADYGIVVGRKGIRYNKNTNDICFITDIIHRAPGNKFERAIYAKAYYDGFDSTMKRRKMFDKFNVEYNVTEADVKDWIRKLKN